MTSHPVSISQFSEIIQVQIHTDRFSCDTIQIPGCESTHSRFVIRTVIFRYQCTDYGFRTHVHPVILVKIQVSFLVLFNFLHLLTVFFKDPGILFQRADIPA
ncbi:hypothetical protein D3C86_1270940 [compost metagenome]